MATRDAGLDIMQIKAADVPLPHAARTLAEARKDCLERFGFSVVRGFPISIYDPEMQARIYWCVSRHLGDPVPQNRNGHMIGHVIDVGDDVNDPTKRITQTTAKLQFHGDSCDVIGLMCLHPAMAGGESRIVSVTTMHDEMFRRAPDLCRALHLPLIEDRRGEVPPGGNPWAAIPIFMWNGKRLAGYGPLDAYLESAKRYTDAPPMSQEQWDGLRLFREICEEPGVALNTNLQVGDIQYMHNPVVFHARRSYRDWPEPERRRHLMRIWLSMPDGPELPQSMAERWIVIERGALRGGVHSAGRKAPNIPLDPTIRAFA
ncbi:TauD/TfdA family dioxygenase [Stella sp.]|uniref:TauD/TfdA family dioxygenase n=1 Tax=Stella sp. TaxID=2912054 RepID=UPI0035B4E608